MTTLILWIGLSIAVGEGAEKRYGRHCGAWFILSLIFSPVLGFAFLVAAGPKAKRAPKRHVPPPLPNESLDVVIARLRGETA